MPSFFGKSRMPLCFYNWKHIYFTEKSFLVNFFSSMAATGIKCQNNKPIPIFESDVCAFAYLDLSVEPSFKMNTFPYYRSSGSSKLHCNLAPAHYCCAVRGLDLITSCVICKSFKTKRSVAGFVTGSSVRRHGPRWK